MERSGPLSSNTAVSKASSGKKRIKLSLKENITRPPPKKAKLPAKPNSSAPERPPTSEEAIALAKTLEAETAVNKEKLQAMCPRVASSEAAELLPRTLAFIRHHSELCDQSNKSNFSSLEEILRQEDEMKFEGITFSIYHCCGHLDVLRALQNSTKHKGVNTLTILLLRVLFLLCCRQERYGGGISGVNSVIDIVPRLKSSLVCAGAINTVFEIIEELSQMGFNLVGARKEANVVTIRDCFNIIFALVRAKRFEGLAKIVQLGVPRRSLCIFQSYPTDPTVVDGVAYLWLELVEELFHPGASDPASWVEKESPNNDANTGLLDDAQELFTKAERYFSNDRDHSDVHQTVEWALEQVLEICDGSDDDGDDGDGGDVDWDNEEEEEDDDDGRHCTRLSKESILPPNFFDDAHTKEEEEEDDDEETPFWMAFTTSTLRKPNSDKIVLHRQRY